MPNTVVARLCKVGRVILSDGAPFAPESKNLYGAQRDPSTPLRSAQDDE